MVMGKQFLLVEPIAKTPYPPLGLMKISTWLRKKHKGCQVFGTVGTTPPPGLVRPHEVYVTSLFTWDLDKLAKTVRFYAAQFPRAKIHIGGIAASLLPDHVQKATGIKPHCGLLTGAEECAPDYSLTFGRQINASITFASRGCPRRCRFCCVRTHEPEFLVRQDWEKDVNPDLPRIVFWDNNWLASPNFGADCDRIRRLGKTVDFNQGLDARLYIESTAKALGTIRLDPIRFAFDDVVMEAKMMRAIELARRYSPGEIRVYVLYNFQDSPEDLYYRLNLLNRQHVLSFPMEYRKPTPSKAKQPGQHWNLPLLRAFKLSLLFYYRRGMITESRRSFSSIYGRTAKQFVERLYRIYDYDKSLKR